MKYKEFAVGYYQPTAAFATIQEHTAVMDAHTMTLIASTGPAHDQDSEETARLFAATPEMLLALDAMEEYLRSCVHTVLERQQMTKIVVKAIKKAKGLNQ
jgi:hypothetical protein